MLRNSHWSYSGSISIWFNAVDGHLEVNDTGCGSPRLIAVSPEYTGAVIQVPSATRTRCMSIPHGPCTHGLGTVQIVRIPKKMGFWFRPNIIGF